MSKEKDERVITFLEAIRAAKMGKNVRLLGDGWVYTPKEFLSERWTILEIESWCIIED